MTLQTRYSFYVLFSALLAATGHILTEIALQFYAVTPFLIVLLSDLIGGGLLLMAAKRQRTNVWTNWRRSDWGRIIVAALAIYVFSFLTRFSAIGLIGASKAVLLGRLETIFVVALAILFLGEALSPRHWLAGLLALGGTILINLDAGAWQLQLGWGEVLSILAAFGLAIGIVTLKPLLDRLDTQWTTGLALLLGAIFLFPFIPFYAASMGVGWAAFLIILLIGVLRGVAWSTYNVAMRHIGASRSVIIFLTSAFFTVIAQVIVAALGPNLGLQVPPNLAMALTGGLVIVLGIIILQHKAEPVKAVTDAR